MKKIFTITIILGVCFSLKAQDYEWAKSMGGTNGDVGYSIALDDAGNVYTAGIFSGTVDFDPGIGTYNLTSTGGSTFICKLDAAGDFVWARNIETISFGKRFISIDN